MGQQDMNGWKGKLIVAGALLAISWAAWVTLFIGQGGRFTQRNGLELELRMMREFDKYPPPELLGRVDATEKAVIVIKSDLGYIRKQVEKISNSIHAHE